MSFSHVQFHVHNRLFWRSNLKALWTVLHYLHYTVSGSFKRVLSVHWNWNVCLFLFFSVTLQVLYKVKTAKIFEKPKNKVLDGQEDDPFAIYMIYLDQESRLLTLAGATHVILFKFSKQEASIEVPVRYILYLKLMLL